MKNIKAVAPYTHPGSINFKTAAYNAWVKAGGKVAGSHYPIRALHGFAYRYELLTVFKNNKEARLRFVEPVSIRFDTFPDYARYEIIPFVWDCWPDMFELTCRWFIRHDVKTAIFTSSQTAELMRRRFPEMNILTITEGIDTSLYHAGRDLKDRKIDLLEFGRSNKRIFKASPPVNANHVCTNVNGRYLYTNEQLFRAMEDAKITISLPRCDTQPEKAGGIETLTQRYWEAMLSRMVMLGRAPRELTDLIGYNPVVDLDAEHANEQIADMLAHIGEYQPLVDKNRECALKMADWTLRMRYVMKFLGECGYIVK